MVIPIADKPVFRDANAEDIPGIIRMLADDPLGQQRENPDEPLQDSYYTAYQHIQDDPNNSLIVAVAEQQVIAVMQLTFIPNLTYQGSWRALIEGVRVAAGQRARGIGKRLLEYAIERARQRGCRLLQLTTDRQRPQALAFYQRLGFSDSHHGLKLQLK